MLAINKIAPIGLHQCDGERGVAQAVQNGEKPVDQLLLVEQVVDPGLALHGGVEFGVLLGMLQLDDERRRERILAGQILELRESCVIASL